MKPEIIRAFFENIVFLWDKNEASFKICQTLPCTFKKLDNSWTFAKEKYFN